MRFARGGGGAVTSARFAQQPSRGQDGRLWGRGRDLKNLPQSILCVGDLGPPVISKLREEKAVARYVYCVKSEFRHYWPGPAPGRMIMYFLGGFWIYVAIAAAYDAAASFSSVPPYPQNPRHLFQNLCLVGFQCLNLGHEVMH